MSNDYTFVSDLKNGGGGHSYGKPELVPIMQNVQKFDKYDMIQKYLHENKQYIHDDNDNDDNEESDDDSDDSDNECDNNYFHYYGIPIIILLIIILYNVYKIRKELTGM